MKTAIIAEKPSVAREIAAIVGANHKEDGFLSGNNYFVTWAFGHLVQLAMPEDYGFSGFVRENLPIVPETLILKPRQVKEGREFKDDKGALRQLKIIKHIFDSCDTIIVATDAGREGELIFRYIYSHLNCQKPFKRLWISSLTDKAIREGLQKLKNGSEYDTLYHAAKARSEADWLVGINASQALSIAAGQGVFSLGRVQTPTLAMICRRFLENKHFSPTPFWQIKVETEKANVPFSVISQKRYEDKSDASLIFEKLQGNCLTVSSIEKKEVNQEPPLLYDLTALQKEANSKHDFSADKTLSVAQKLYESKFISYPRTGSRYISEDIFEEVPELIDVLKSHSRFGVYAQPLSTKKMNDNSVNDKKVTDHHAILITENVPTGLSGDEQIIYEMIAGRMLEAFSEKCVKDITTIVLSGGDALFEEKGVIVKQMGWRIVFDDRDNGDSGDESDNLPDVQENDVLPVLRSELLKKQTKPKPLHTEASLLSAMESAGKDTSPPALSKGEGADERAALKESGIGTPATRAAIIETLFSRNYIVREKKSLVPTEKGLSVYETVKDKRIADVSLTGSWENSLAQIEQGAFSPDTFKKTIEVYAGQITAELLEAKIELPDSNTPICPKCKTAHVRFYAKVVKCTDQSCGLTVFRIKSEKELTDKQITELLTKLKTSVISGFKSKGGKVFSAVLKFDAEWRVVFDFEKGKGKK